MARFYADEHFPHPTVWALRQLGHDVLTVQEAGQANLQIDDADVLAFATAQQRAVLTNNRRDFFRLHAHSQSHAEIVACTTNPDFDHLASRIHAAIERFESLQGRLIRVYRAG